MSFPKDMRDALQYGASIKRKFGATYNAHTFESTRGAYGTFVYHYMQGMLMNLWHVESGTVWSTPLIYDRWEYDRADRNFRRAVEQLTKEGVT